jgi:hypothetical protein
MLNVPRSPRCFFMLLLTPCFPDLLSASAACCAS